MQFLTTRGRRPSAPADVCPSPQSGTRPYGNAVYGSTTALLPAQYPGKRLPMTPPPPYQAYYDNNYPQPLPPYAQHRQPQQNLVPFAPQAPSSAWSSTSMLDVSRPQTAGALGQAHGWQNSRNGAPQPVAGGNATCAIARGMNQGSAFCDRLATTLADIFSRPDQEVTDVAQLEAMTRGLELKDDETDVVGSSSRPILGRGRPAVQQQSPGHGIINFRKTWMYANSRLPPSMVDFKAYLPTWTLVCRAAQASTEVYKRPKKDAREYYTDADPRQGTKATIIKSQTVDDKKLLVVAIRGSQKNIVDWTVNFAVAPTQPVGFLDDEGNACHAGFLQVARAMVGPIAAQLRHLIQQDPSWASSSLLFTGHSAGGAVASLLFMHMLAKTVESDLTVLAGVFRRIHCVTFGTPPLSLLPLQLPASRNGRNQFLSFANEGDLVIRADWAYIKSLAQLLAAPAPTTGARHRLRGACSRQRVRDAAPLRSTPPRAPKWPVPEASLSTAGRMVLLRQQPHDTNGTVQAVQLSDGELRGVVFGDPAMHLMTLYKERIDELAFAAVSGRDIG